MRDGFHGTVSNKVEGPTARQSGMVMVGRIESADTSSIFAAVLCLFFIIVPPSELTLFYSSEASEVFRGQRHGDGAPRCHGE